MNCGKPINYNNKICSLCGNNQLDFLIPQNDEISEDATREQLNIPVSSIVAEHKITPDLNTRLIQFLDNFNKKADSIAGGRKIVYIGLAGIVIGLFSLIFKTNTHGEESSGGVTVEVTVDKESCEHVNDFVVNQFSGLSIIDILSRDMQVSMKQIKILKTELVPYYSRTACLVKFDTPKGVVNCVGKNIYRTGNEKNTFVDIVYTDCYR